MPEEHQNRRGYFRINDRVELQVRELEEGEKSALDINHKKRCGVCDTANAKFDIKLEPPRSLKLIGRRYPEIIEYIEQLEQKIVDLDEVKNHLPIGETIKFRQLVNISGDGIRFSFPEALPIDDVVELIITLEPEKFRFLVFGTVVRCAENKLENGDCNWSIAVHFTHIREPDQDYLIKHILTRQMETVRVEAI